MENARVELRGIMLRDQANQFLAKYPGEKAVIIAHSEGGIDARFAVKTLGLKNISAIVTIGTPHRGTSLADWVIHQSSEKTVLYWLVRVFGNYDLNQLPFVGEMTASFMERQKDKFDVVPEVGTPLLKEFVTRIVFGHSGSWTSSAEPTSGRRRYRGWIIPASSQRFGEDWEATTWIISPKSTSIRRRLPRENVCWNESGPF